MNKYDIIFESLQDKVNSGELAIEDAEILNDVAYEKYVFEKKTTAEYRLQKFKKKHNYDPKDGTIEMNGERVKFKTGGSNKHNTKVEGSISSYGKVWKNLGEVPELYMNKASFNMKHPNTHEFIFRHEEGHMKAKDVKDKEDESIKKRKEKKREFHSNYMDSILKDLKSGKISEDEGLKKIDKLNKSKLLSSDEKSSYDKIKHEIEKYIDKSKVNTEHGRNPDEYIADGYAADKTGIRDARRFFDYASKTHKKEYTKIKKKTLDTPEVRDAKKNNRKLYDQCVENMDKGELHDYIDEYSARKKSIKKFKDNDQMRKIIKSGK